MNCPVCHVPLTIAQRQGIEIDHCPRCRGVWLDRGELDKIIERSAAPAYRADYDDDDDFHEGRRYGEREEHRRRGRRSFLDDLFDFG